jgi:hypothetical protein
MARYNGHKNWNHWNVSLWIGNDEGIYNLAREMIRTHRNRDAAARSLLELLPEKTPDGAPYSFSAVRAAIAGLT